MAGVSEMPLCGNGVLGGRYALGEVIGRGGMAEVYRAWDQVLERSVAVKMLRVSASDPADRARFARETSTLADSPTRSVGEVIFSVVLSACLWSAPG
jgi:eukaryotic-like serine/threonine-protein kinase